MIALAGTVGATLSSWLPLTMLAILKLLGLNFGTQFWEEWEQKGTNLTAAVNSLRIGLADFCDGCYVFNTKSSISPFLGKFMTTETLTRAIKQATQVLGSP